MLRNLAFWVLRPPAVRAALLPQAAGGGTASLWADAGAALDENDPLEQMAQADAADASLLRLVLCAASATLMLALVTSLF